MRKTVSGCIIVLLAICPTASPVGAAARPSPAARAWIVVDHSDGTIITAHNDRAAMSPASLTKLMTALVVEESSTDAPVVVSRRAAETAPTKLGLREGEVWSREDLLHAMLLASSNDAAVALAESVSGSLDAFSEARRRAADRLQLVDSPRFNDPAGLDSPTEGHAGGDAVSARDMATIARAVLAKPELAAIVAKQRYDFTSPDGTRRFVNNHNKMLAGYPGMVGIKTGYTNRAMHTYAGAATRNGRTLVVVVLGAASTYSLATELLDESFAAPAPDNERLELRVLDRAEPVAPVLGQAGAETGSTAGLLAAVVTTTFVALRTRSRRARTQRNAR